MATTTIGHLAVLHDELRGTSILSLLDAASGTRLKAIASRASTHGAQGSSQRIVGGLDLAAEGGAPFRAEATLSHHVRREQGHFTSSSRACSSHPDRVSPG